MYLELHENDNLKAMLSMMFLLQYHDTMLPYHILIEHVQQIKSGTILLFLCTVCRVSMTALSLMGDSMTTGIERFWACPKNAAATRILQYHPKQPELLSDFLEQ